MTPIPSTARATGAYDACLTTLKRKHALQSEVNVFYECFYFKMIYRPTILSVVLYGCETWSLTLREERRLRALENRVLKRIFGPKRDEVTMEWRKLHNEELNDLYSISSIIRMIKSRRMRWVEHLARMGRGEAYAEF